MDTHSSNALDTALAQLSSSMGGVNYQPTMSAVQLTSTTLEDSRDELRSAFPRFDPTADAFVEIDGDEALQELQVCFDFRGDHEAGLLLSSEEEAALRSAQGEFIEQLRDTVMDTTIYTCGEVRGLPASAVFWEFCLLFVGARESWLIFGAASD